MSVFGYFQKWSYGESHRNQSLLFEYSDSERLSILMVYDWRIWILLNIIPLWPLWYNMLRVLLLYLAKNRLLGEKSFYIEDSTLF